MDQVLAETSAFKLTKRSKNQKKWYEISADPYRIEGFYVHSASGEYRGTFEDVRDFFDPTRSKSGKWGRKWKYKNRKDAEQMFMLATMKWIST